MSNDFETARMTCAVNDPGSEHWSEDSFVGRLTEQATFDEGLFAELERAIVTVAKASPGAEAVWALLRILERVTLLTGAHLDPRDVYRIGNLDDERVADFNNHFRFTLRELSLQTQAG
ncbi:MAG TPA: hypothetical protein VHH11_03305 [Gammaproteobacteria bacterium]|nr:hypothetical protein [Gammaproteobacteria bacterium]